MTVNHPKLLKQPAGGYIPIPGPPYKPPFTIPVTTMVSPRNPHYNCCGIHPISGSKLVAFIEIAWSIALFIFCIVGVSVGFMNVGLMSTLSIYTGINLIVAVLILIGIRKTRAGFLVPYMIVKVLNVIFSGALVVLAIFAFLIGSASVALFQSFAEGPEEKKQNAEGVLRSSTVTAIAVLCVAVLAILFVIWFFFLILKGYRFLRDSAYPMLSPVVVQYQPPPGGGASDPQMKTIAEMQQHRPPPPPYHGRKSSQPDDTIGSNDFEEETNLIRAQPEENQTNIS